MVVWRGVHGMCGVFFQTCSRTLSNHLPVVDSPQCWGMVTCSWLSLSDRSTLMLSHWKRIRSLAYLNNSFFASLISFSSVYLACLYKISYPFLKASSLA